MLTSLWRKAAAAVVGMAALVSAAQAQQVAPAPMPTNPAIPAVVPQALPTAAPPAVAAPAPAPAAPIIVPGAPAIAPGAGCATGDCGSTGGKHHFGDKCGIGVGTASSAGCGCWKSEWTFLAGSCKQFFSPGRTCCGEATRYQGCGGYCGGLFGKHGNCPPVEYAQPYGRRPNNCAGPFTYHDR
jgi:hypothetical protein